MQHSLIPLNPAVILVVDDQPRNLQLLKASLSKEGFHVVTASSGDDALQKVEQQTPDLILLDVMMPGMDGFDVCTRIKGDPAMSDIPIIFLTGETQLQSIKRGFEVGGVDYVTKPFNRHELVARVNTQVELRRARRRHTEELMERTRIINIIAQHWHKPLQRLVFLTHETKEFCRTASRAEVPSMATLSAEAEMTATHMLSSLEDFLHESAGEVSGSHGAPNGQITTHDLKAIVAKWYVSAIRRQIDFQLKAPHTSIPVPASAFVATQIIDPILSNAVNAAPENGTISAMVHHDGGRVILDVEDDGPGFPRQYLERPFQPCVRTPGVSAAAQHLGIGLALAKRAADRISATVELTNRKAGGARVRVAFPAPKKGTHA